LVQLGITYEGNEEFKKLLKLSEDGYREEWDSIGSERHGYIAKASKMARLKDANERLNHAAAKVTNRIIGNAGRQVTVINLGAGTGNTTLSVIQGLKSSDIERTFFILIDPARDGIQDAKCGLRQAGLTEGKHFRAVVATDRLRGIWSP